MTSTKIKSLFVLTVISALMTGMLIPSYADKDKKNNPLQPIYDILGDHETRLVAVESDTHVNVAGTQTVTLLALAGSDPILPAGSPTPLPLPQSCIDRGVLMTEFITNFDTNSTNWFYNGWCPESEYPIYFIPDPAVTNTSIVLSRFGDLDPNLGLSPPEGHVLDVGTFEDVNGTQYTGFIAQAVGNHPRDGQSLSWAIMN